MHNSRTTGPALRFLRKPLVVALAAGCFGLGAQLPVSAAISLDSEVIINFDFTTNAGNTPPGGYPYSEVEVFFNFLGLPSDTVNFKIYGDLNGGALLSSQTFGPPANYTFFSSLAGLGDGKFSFGLQSDDRDLNFLPSAIGCKEDGGECFDEDPNVFETSPIAGSLGTASVPEPASLALLGIAMAGLAATRRKRRA